MFLAIIKSAIIVKLKNLKYLSLPFLTIFCLNTSLFLNFSIFFDKSLSFVYVIISYFLNKSLIFVFFYQSLPILT